MKSAVLAILMTALLGSLVSCSGEHPRELVLFDFESDADLDRLHWTCHTLYTISEQHATHGDSSLQLELYPSDYPGLEMPPPFRDWLGYDSLLFEVFNPEKEELPVTVRIDDMKDYPDYDDRFSEVLLLRPGLNRVNIPLSSLVTSGTKRHLDLKEIHRFFLYMTKPSRRFVLYVDYVRLRR